jgi:hypothetical protein
LERSRHDFVDMSSTLRVSPVWFAPARRFVQFQAPA